ncbi:SDR family NAD(P)-dependent oxidoreductase [Fulvivirgaceae bacterium LMO-SS25]
MKFKNKIVWITGASSGIGRALALEFARQGAIVAVTARRVELLKKLVIEIKAEGGNAKAFYCDILNDSSIQKCISDLISEYGKLDIAIANAGFGVVGKIEDLTEKDWQRQLNGNVVGLALTIKYALPELRKTQGRIVLMGSVSAFVPSPNVGAYGASKAAVHSIGETLQVELLGSGVTCTTIHPGFVVSEITRIDNDGSYHKDREDPRPSNLMWPTNRAAKVIVNAIAKRKKVFVFTGHGKIAVFLGKFLPSIARKITSKTAK